MFGSAGAFGFFDLQVASDSIEHGHLSLLDRCNSIVDGERSVFVQQLSIIRSAFNAKIVLPLGYFRLRSPMSAAIFAFIPFHLADDVLVYLSDRFLGTRPAFSKFESYQAALSSL
jgi:hypothetical protein